MDWSVNKNRPYYHYYYYYCVQSDPSELLKYHVLYGDEWNKNQSSGNEKLQIK